MKKKLNLTEGEKFARKCDATGEGMNEGYCFGEGEAYFKSGRDALAYAKTLGYKSLNAAYKDDACYYTEWEMPTDAQYIVKRGKLVEIESDGLVMDDLIRDTHEIADIDRANLPKGFEALLPEPDYNDNVLEEHLYNINEVEEEVDGLRLSKEQRKFFNRLKKELDNSGCAYFRIINP